MRYNIKRSYPMSDEKKDAVAKLEDCEILEIMRQLLIAIDGDQDFEAVVCGPEREK